MCDDTTKLLILILFGATITVSDLTQCKGVPVGARHNQLDCTNPKNIITKVIYEEIRTSTLNNLVFYTSHCWIEYQRPGVSFCKEEFIVSLTKSCL